MIARLPRPFIISALLVLTAACAAPDSHCRSQLGNLAGEYETYLFSREEERWKQISLAAGNCVIREIFLAKRNEAMHIALTIDHFMSARDITAIGVRIKEKGDFEPFIALWRGAGLERKTGRDAIVPETIVKASTAATTVISLQGTGGGTSIQTTVYYSPEAVTSWARNLRKRYGTK